MTLHYRGWEIIRARGAANWLATRGTTTYFAKSLTHLVCSIDTHAEPPARPYLWSR